MLLEMKETCACFSAKVLAELGTTQNTLKWRVNGIKPSSGYTNYMDAFEKQKKMLEECK